MVRILSRRAGVFSRQEGIIETDNAEELPDFPFRIAHVTSVHSDRFLLGEMNTAKKMDCKTRKMQGIYIQSTWYLAYIFCMAKVNFNSSTILWIKLRFLLLNIRR
jgi:hypothetical protein